MTSPIDLIKQSRDLCKAATPGPWNVMAVVDEDQIAVISVHAIDLRQCASADEELLDDARTLLPELADALEAALQYKAQLTLTLSQHRDTQQRLRTARTELADYKAKMVDLLAHAYDKGRAFNEDVDDRTSEDD